MKIGIITDIHANLEALELVLSKLRECDEIICLGDLCHFGSDVNNCFELIKKTKNLSMVKGNHDVYYINRVEDKTIENMSSDLVQYIDYMKNNTSKEVYLYLKKLPYIITRKIGEKVLAFTHFGWENENETKKVGLLPLSNENLIETFSGIDSDYIFFGHTHIPQESKLFFGDKEKTYINVGPLGTPGRDNNVASYGIIEIIEGSSVNVMRFETPYDVQKTINKISSLDTEYKSVILKKFFIS